MIGSATHSILYSSTEHNSQHVSRIDHCCTGKEENIACDVPLPLYFIQLMYIPTMKLYGETQHLELYFSCYSLCLKVSDNSSTAASELFCMACSRSVFETLIDFQTVVDVDRIYIRP